MWVCVPALRSQSPSPQTNSPSITVTLPSISTLTLPSYSVEFANVSPYEITVAVGKLKYGVATSISTVEPAMLAI